MITINFAKIWTLKGRHKKSCFTLVSRY